MYFPKLVYLLFLSVILTSTAFAVGMNSIRADQNVLPISDFVDAQGRLALPEGFSGSLDPSGFQIVSSDGEPLRFAKAGQVDTRWSGAETVGSGCNNWISAVAIDAAGRVYVGGAFTQCGNVAARRVAVFDPVTQAWSSLGTGAANGVNNVVMALAVAGSDLYVGGNFTRAGETWSSGIARFNTATQTWSFLGTMNGSVSAIAISGSDVYVGGGFTRFTQAGGILANRVARFDTLTETWSPLGSGTTNGIGEFGVVYAVAINGSDVYVGGSFWEAGGTTANNVARFNITTQTWSPFGAGSANGVNSTVTAFALVSNDIYVGGLFTQAGGAPANYLARFDVLTQTWSPLGSGAANGTNATVTDLAIVGSDLYVGGGFNQAGGLAANHIGRFNTTTQTWSGTGSELNGSVNALAVSGSEVYVGGNATQAGAVPVNHLARFNSVAQSWSPLDSGAADGLNGTAIAYAISGSDVYLGGDFTRAGRVSANRVIRFDKTTQTWSSLGNGIANGVNGRVYTIAVTGTDVYVGGSFTQAGGVLANRVARFNTLTQSWAPLGNGAENGVNNDVHAIAVIGNDVYVGGRYTQAGGLSANRVARFNAMTQSWSLLGSAASNGVNNDVNTIAVTGSDVYVGGLFSEAGGILARNVARFNTTTQAWTSLGSGAANGVGGVVHVIAIDRSDIYVGGGFGTVGGVLGSHRVARFNTTTQSWSALGLGWTTEAAVYALVIAGNDVYVGANVTMTGSATVNRVARFNNVSRYWNALGNGVPYGAVRALALDSGILTVAGAFGEAGSTVTSNLARYRIGLPTTVALGTSPQRVDGHSDHGPLVSGGLGVPTGEIRVRVRDGGSCSMTAPSGSCSITLDFTGMSTVTAIYGGNGDYESNASVAIPITATPGLTMNFHASVSVEPRVFASGFEQP